MPTSLLELSTPVDHRVCLAIDACALRPSARICVFLNKCLDKRKIVQSLQNSQSALASQSIKAVHGKLLERELKEELSAAWDALQKSSAATSDRWNNFNHHKGCLNEHQFPSLLEAAAQDQRRAAELIARQSVRRASFAIARTALVQSVHVLIDRREQFNRTVLKVHSALQFAVDPHLCASVAAELITYVQQAEAINEKFIERTQRESDADVTEGAARRVLRTLYREVVQSGKLGGERQVVLDTYGLLSISFERLERSHPLCAINERLVSALAKLQRGAGYHQIWGWTNHLDPIEWQKLLGQYKLLKTNLDEARYTDQIERALAANRGETTSHMIAAQNEKRSKLAQARQQVTNVLADVMMAANEAQEVLRDLLAMDFAHLKSDETDWHHRKPVDTVMCNIVLADALCRHAHALNLDWVRELNETQEQATNAAKSLKASLAKLLDKPQYKGLQGTWYRTGGTHYFYTEAL